MSGALRKRRVLKKAERAVVKRGLEKLETSFRETAVPPGTIALVSMHGVFRLRIGDHRVLYPVDISRSRIVVIKIDKRERVYG